MSTAKILIIHNRHAVRGGEDTVVDQEVRLLREHGHLVDLVEPSNEDIPFSSVTDKLAAGVGTVWSSVGYGLVEKAVKCFRPDVAHIHNTFNRLSPSVYWALARHKIPIAATMHNYLPLCANAGFVRDGKICLDCLPGLPLPGIRHKCYNGSLAASAAVVGMQIIHTKILRTFSGKGHAFIVPSTRGLAFYRQAGWPDQKLFYKPHFVNDPIKSRDTSFPERERTILFVGRLSAEKGVCELLEAWAQLETDWTLTIVGTGVLEHKLRDTYASLKNVVWRGWCAGEEVHRLMQAARFLIAPSIWHEPFGMVAVEALACGTPVLASNRGGFTDIVVDEENGVLFEPSSALIKTVLHRVFDQDDRQWFNWAKQAREAYLKHYQPEDSYARLIEIYEAAKVNSKTGFPPARE